MLGDPSDQRAITIEPDEILTPTPSDRCGAKSTIRRRPTVVAHKLTAAYRRQAQRVRTPTGVVVGQQR